MSFAALLTHQATILRAVDGAADDYGNPARAWQSSGVWPARLEQTAAAEVTVGADTQTADWRLYLPPEAELSGLDRVTVDGTTFEVVGPPEMVRTPRGPHHVEARLRSVS